MMSRLVRIAERIDLGPGDVGRNARLGLSALAVAVAALLALWGLRGVPPWVPDPLLGLAMVVLWVIAGLAFLFASLGLMAALLSGAFWLAWGLVGRGR